MYLYNRTNTRKKNIFLDFAKKYAEETLHRKLEIVLDRILTSRKENMTNEEIISITEEIRDDKKYRTKNIRRKCFFSFKDI